MIEPGNILIVLGRLAEVEMTDLTAQRIAAKV
jgi:hypothetical protein